MYNIRRMRRIAGAALLLPVLLLFAMPDVFARSQTIGNWYDELLNAGSGSANTNDTLTMNGYSTAYLNMSQNWYLKELTILNDYAVSEALLSFYVQRSLTITDKTTLADGAELLIKNAVNFDFGTVVVDGSSATINLVASSLTGVITLSGDNEDTLTLLNNTAGMTISAGNSGALKIYKLETANSITLDSSLNAITIGAGGTVFSSGSQTLTTTGSNAIALGTVTGSGSIVLGGSGTRSLAGTSITTLQVIGSGTVTASGALTVGTLDIDQTFELATGEYDFSAGTTDIASGKTLTVGGNATIDLGTLIAGTSTLVTTGNVAFTSNASGLTLQTAGASTISASGGDIIVGTLDIDAATTLDSTGAAITAGSTDIATDITLTVTGGGTVNLGTVTSSGSGNGNLTTSGTDLTTGSMTAGVVTVDGNLTASGDVIVGSLNVSGDVEVTGAGVIANSDITVGGTLSTVTSGNVNAVNVTAGAINLASNLLVSGNITTNGSSTATLVAYGLVVSGDCVLDTAGTVTIGADGTTVEAGKTLTLSTGTASDNFGSVTLESGSTLDITSSSAKSFSGFDVSAGNATIKVGSQSTAKLGSLDFSGTAASGVLVLDFGSSEAADSGAKVTGTIIDSATKVTGTAAQLVNVYGINGVSGTTYTHVFSTAISSTGDSFEDGDTLNTEDAYRLYTLTNNATGVIVTTNTAAVDSAVEGGGGSARAAAGFTYLLNNQIDFNTEGQEFVDRFNNLSGSALGRAANELVGEGATTAAMQAALSGVSQAVAAVSSQMSAFRSGGMASALASNFSSGGATAALGDMADADTLAESYEAVTEEDGAETEEIYNKVRVWSNVYGGWGDQGSEGYMSGYDFYNVGVMCGLDYAFGSELRVGALFGYTYNKTKVYYNQGNSTDNVLRIGVYAAYNWDDFFIDLSPTAGIHLLESERNLIVNGLTAKGERTGVDFNLTGTIGYDFELPYEFTVTPSYSLGYTRFYDPEYSETGAGAGNLKVDSFTSNSLLQDIGIKAGRLFSVSDSLAFLPEVWGGWEVEYLNTGGMRNSTTAAVIGGQTYATTMNGMATHRGYWGAGLTALVNDNISVFGRYDHKIWHKGYNAGFSAGIKIDF